MDAVSAAFSESSDGRRDFFLFFLCGTSVVEADSLTTDAVSVDVPDDLEIAIEHSRYHWAR